MTRKQPNEMQIGIALRETESGTSVAEISRKIGFSEQTFYRRKKKFAELRVADVQRLKQIYEENRKLKQLVADLSLNAGGYCAGNDLMSDRLRTLVKMLKVTYNQLSACRAC